MLLSCESLKEKFFYEYNFDEIFGRDAVDFHAMSCEHTEVLGQFMDNVGMSVDQLKD